MSHQDIHIIMYVFENPENHSHHRQLSVSNELRVPSSYDVGNDPVRGRERVVRNAFPS